MKIRSWQFWLALLLAGFVASLVWSFLFESLLPLMEAGAWNEVAGQSLGFLLILLGTGGFLWSLWLLMLELAGVERRWRRPALLLLISVALIQFGARLTY